jgi:hypothetical protein
LEEIIDLCFNAIGMFSCVCALNAWFIGNHPNFTNLKIDANLYNSNKCRHGGCNYGKQVFGVEQPRYWL